MTEACHPCFQDGFLQGGDLLLMVLFEVRSFKLSQRHSLLETEEASVRFFPFSSILISLQCVRVRWCHVWLPLNTVAWTTVWHWSSQFSVLVEFSSVVLAWVFSWCCSRILAGATVSWESKWVWSSTHCRYVATLDTGYCLELISDCHLVCLCSIMAVVCSVHHPPGDSEKFEFS